MTYPAFKGVSHRVTLCSQLIGVAVSTKVHTNETAAIKEVGLSFGLKAVWKVFFYEGVNVLKTFDDDFAVHGFVFTHGESPFSLLMSKTGRQAVWIFRRPYILTWETSHMVER
tara:strand:+ start:181 stop:519 length:339 start_codon:yes stop_codon:yes gene_type:complete